MKLIVIIDDVLVYPESLINNLKNYIKEKHNKEPDKVYCIHKKNTICDIGDLLILDISCKKGISCYDFGYLETVYVGRESIGAKDNIEVKKYILIGHDGSGEYLILEHQNSEIRWAPEIW